MNNFGRCFQGWTVNEIRMNSYCEWVWSAMMFDSHFWVSNYWKLGTSLKYAAYQLRISILTWQNGRYFFFGSGGGGCQTFLGDVCFSLFEKAWVDQQYDPQTSTIFLKWWLCHPRGSNPQPKGFIGLGFMTGIPIFMGMTFGSSPSSNRRRKYMSSINILLTLFLELTGAAKAPENWCFEDKSWKSCGWMVKRCHLQAMGMERADRSVQDSFHWVWVVHPDREILQQTLASWKYFSLSCTVNPPPKRSEHLHLSCGTSQFRSQRWRVAFGLARLRWKKKSMLQERRSLTDVQWLAAV